MALATPAFPPAVRSRQLAEHLPLTPARRVVATELLAPR
jgi:hypothetical protein